MNIIIMACLCTSLVCIELPSRELDLFTRLEGGHAQIRAACTAKSVTKVTLQFQGKDMCLIRSHRNIQCIGKHIQ